MHRRDIAASPGSRSPRSRVPGLLLGTLTAEKPAAARERVATPDDTIWTRDAHTGVKHQILRRYLDAWFPILLNVFPSVTVFEGYAGPGVYEGGQPGSPVVAIDALMARADRLVDRRKPVRFVFVEERADRVERLRSEVDRRWPSLPLWVTVDVVHGPCEAVGMDALNRAKAWGAPIFANLDPFGAGVPYDLVKRIGANKASEVFVTFMSAWFTRFYGHDNIEDGDRMFGHKRWRAVKEQGSPEAKEQFLLDEYRAALRSAKLEIVSSFKLIDDGGRAFWLTHGTSSEAGLEKIKNAFWKSDPIQGFRFRDPRDDAQSDIFDLFGDADWQPGTPALQRLIIEWLQHAGRQEVEAVRWWVLHNTVYRPTHASTALGELINRGAVRRDPVGGRLVGSVAVEAV
jgi:three-Cys-motif partner protein